MKVSPSREHKEYHCITPDEILKAQFIAHANKLIAKSKQEKEDAHIQDSQNKKLQKKSHC